MKTEILTRPIPKYCPRCAGEMRTESIGWICKKCLGFVDMRGRFHEHEEKPFAPPTTSDESVFLDALNTYGMREQITMVFEEMSELQKELCKYLRGDDAVTIANIAEEIADVEIMLAQMKLFFKCSAEVADWRKRKIDRLQRRLNGDV